MYNLKQDAELRRNSQSPLKVVIRSILRSNRMVRNQENFLVLMENYDTALSYATTAANSTGTAMEKMAIYENSVEASTKRLTASFESLSTTIINSDLVKSFYNFSTGFINGLDSIIKNLGEIPTLIGAITAAVSLLGKDAG